MRRRIAAWLAEIGRFGRDLAVVWAAEKELLQAEIRASAARVRQAAILAGIAGLLVAAALVALIITAHELLRLVLPPWAAALVLALGLALLAWMVLLFARTRLRGAENPARTVRRRWSDHRRWWSEKILSERLGEADGEEGD